MSYDNWIIPFGKYRFTALCRIPANYLIGLYGDAKAMANYPEIKAFIESNMGNLKDNQEKVRVVEDIQMPCAKYLYLTEREASKELARIQRTGPGSKPIRYYYCEKCGGWHLTSKKVGQFGKSE